MTRVAYVAFLPKPTPGVERSLQEKAAAVASIGADIDFWVVGERFEEPSTGLYFREVHSRLPTILHAPLKAFRRFRLIEESVPVSSYDLFVLRYPAADPSGPRFVRNVPVITEHHSVALAEMASYELSRLSFGERQVKRARRLMEQRYGGKILRRIRGMIAVTDEIRYRELDRAKAMTSVPAVTVPNGINVDAVTPTGFVPFTGSELHIAFVAAGLRPWHGLDRVTAGLRRYSGRAGITLHLIGDILPSAELDVQTRHVTTVFHGVLSGAELDDVMKRISFAIGSLGVHRKQMREACNLKTREYMARGVPFVISHDDPDLLAEESRRYFLRLPADDSAVDFEDLIDFAESLSGGHKSAELAEAMRAYASRNMSWEPKMERYVDFCHRVVREWEPRR